MKLTDEHKSYIDSLSYEQLAPAGDVWFRGETGRYWSDRMTQLRAEPGGPERHVAASKSIGWPWMVAN